jgi:hypothetical protein
MVRLLALCAMALLSGCVGVPPKAQFADAGRDRLAPWGVVRIDRVSAYLIDPRTESCFLNMVSGSQSVTIVPVSCAKLKKNLPEAATFITWDTTEVALGR